MKKIFLIFSCVLSMFFVGDIFSMESSNSDGDVADESFFNFEDESGQVSAEDFKQALEGIKIFLNSLENSGKKMQALTAIQDFESGQKTKEELITILKKILKKIKVKSVSKLDQKDEDEPSFLCPCSLL